MKYWINVISKEHVLHGVELGITQSGHGKYAPLKKMKKDDWIIFYSPKQTFKGTDKLQAFTAIGQLSDEEIYRAEMTPTFHPYRRKIEFIKKAKEVPIQPLIEKLKFIEDKKHWGFKFRFGLFEISKEDFELIKKEMKA